MKKRRLSQLSEEERRLIQEDARRYRPSKCRPSARFPLRLAAAHERIEWRKTNEAGFEFLFPGP